MHEELQIKKQLLQRCKSELAERRIKIQERLYDIVSGLQSETKSSAGDKHETGRAMLQIEREQVGRQLAEIEKQEQIVNRIQLHKQERVALGSVIITDSRNYFIATSLDKCIVNSLTYYPIGLGTPIGQLLLGKQQGEILHFRDTTFTILNNY